MAKASIWPARRRSVAP